MRLLHVEANQRHPITRREPSEGYVLVFYMDTRHADSSAEGAIFRYRQVSSTVKTTFDADNAPAAVIHERDFPDFDGMRRYARRELGIASFPATVEAALVQETPQ